jgi:hypothetical protein
MKNRKWVIAAGFVLMVTLALGMIAWLVYENEVVDPAKKIETYRQGMRSGAVISVITQTEAMCKALDEKMCTSIRLQLVQHSVEFINALPDDKIKQLMEIPFESTSEPEISL